MKTETHQIRLTAEEMAQYQDDAKRAGVTVSELIRQTMARTKACDACDGTGRVTIEVWPRASIIEPEEPAEV